LRTALVGMATPEWRRPAHLIFLFFTLLKQRNHGLSGHRPVQNRAASLPAPHWHPGEWLL